MKSSDHLQSCPAPSSESESGFTLVELVLAVAIIGATFATLLFLRLESVQRAGRYNMSRQVQRLAQEQLDLVAFGIIEDTSGDFEELGKPEWYWEVQTTQVSESGPELLECQLTLQYTNYDGEEDEYLLVTWFFPSDDNHLLEGLDTGEDF